MGLLPGTKSPDAPSLDLKKRLEKALQGVCCYPGHIDEWKSLDSVLNEFLEHRFTPEEHPYYFTSTSDTCSTLITELSKAKKSAPQQAIGQKCQLAVWVYFVEAKSAVSVPSASRAESRKRAQEFKDGLVRRRAWTQPLLEHKPDQQQQQELSDWWQTYLDQLIQLLA